jgi:hypothetical protein
MNRPKPSLIPTRTNNAAVILVAVVTFALAPRAMGEDACRPKLTIDEVHFTDMQPPTWSRTRSAIVSVDTAPCAIEDTGTFEIVFVRGKETAPDLEFRELFAWRAPAIKMHVDFAADEAPQSYRIDHVTSCACGG